MYDSARSYQQFLFLESFFIHNYVGIAAGAVLRTEKGHGKGADLYHDLKSVFHVKHIDNLKLKFYSIFNIDNTCSI